CLAVLQACSINKMATRAVADALTGVGESTVFTGDSDPQLVGDALPFAIKIYEALLEQEPNHQGLIVTTGSLFIMYANAFVQGPAEMLPPGEYLAKQEGKERAKNLYLRGVDILSTGIEKRYPGILGSRQTGELDSYLSKLKKADVPLVYWLVAGTLSAYAIDPMNLALGMKLPELTALINRAYELDPDFNTSALDEFFIIFHASIPEGMGGDKSKVGGFFQKALEKTRGLSTGPYVSYAQAVCIPAQDYETFKKYLEAALAIDVNADTGNRLVNIINQRKARYLLDNASYHFIDAESVDWDEWLDE
ncbi:MAG: TRAP transporter TatT component family protein, partial [Treponema sp.]|nr:TRAP transporter TatT component family protein [Treponema sp.]